MFDWFSRMLRKKPAPKLVEEIIRYAAQCQACGRVQFSPWPKGIPNCTGCGNDVYVCFKLPEEMRRFR